MIRESERSEVEERQRQRHKHKHMITTLHTQQLCTGPHGAAAVREGPKVNKKKKEGMYELSGDTITRMSVVVGTVVRNRAYGSVESRKSNGI